MQYTETTVTAAAYSYDLTTLAIAKSELGLKQEDTSKDVWLQRSITQVSKTIAQYCNRVFPVEQLTDTLFVDRSPSSRQVPGHSVTLQLSRWPVATLTSVQALTQPLTLTAYVQGTDFSLNAKVGQLIRLVAETGNATRWGDPEIVASYTAGYGAQVTEPQTIPGSPYQVTVANAASSAVGNITIPQFSVDLGVTYASTGLALTKDASGTPAAGHYTVDASKGLYTFAAADTGLGVSITYGFNQIPDDLVYAVLLAITQRFKARDRDPLLISQTQPGLGETRWLVGNGPNSGRLPFTPEIMALIEPYRVPVTA